MAGLNDSKSKKPWQQDDSEDPFGFDMDDEELFFDDDDNDNEVVEDIAVAAEVIPSWRRIEMTREDRFLREAMADFEDYDEFEDSGRGYHAGFSH